MSRNQVESSLRDERRNVEINIGKVCNNKCVFCLDGMVSKDDHAFMPWPDMQSELAYWRERGHLSVGFLGGEPTFHKGFLPALARAAQLAFEEIVIFTNGVLLPQRGFVEKAAALAGSGMPQQPGREAAEPLLLLPALFVTLGAAVEHLLDATANADPDFGTSRMRDRGRPSARLTRCLLPARDRTTRTLTLHRCHSCTPGFGHAPRKPYASCRSASARRRARVPRAENHGPGT